MRINGSARSGAGWLVSQVVLIVGCAGGCTAIWAQSSPQTPPTPPRQSLASTNLSQKTTKPSPTLKVSQPLGQESLNLSEAMAQVPQWAKTYEAESESLDAEFADSQGLAGRALLLRLMASAIESHPSVLSKQAELAANRKGVESAKWQYFPNLSVTSERGANPASFSTSTNNGTTLRLQQTLWAGGRLDTSVLLSQYKVLGAQILVTETQQSIALRVIDAWQALLGAHGRLNSAEKNLKRLSQLDEMVTRRVLQQVSARIDAEQLKARLLQAQGDQLSASTAYSNAVQRMAQLVGDGLDLKQALNSNLLLQALREGQTRSLSDSAYPQFLDALEQRPNILKFDAELGIAQAEIKLKQAEQWPTVYARLERQFNKTTSPTFGTVSRTIDNSAYLGVQWSTGAGLSLSSQVQAAKFRLEGLINERETALRDSQERLSNEWRDYLSAAQRAQQNALVQRSQVGLLDSYTRLFVAGRRSLIDLLSAVRELTQAEQAVTDVQAQVIASAMRLRVLAGELPWQN